MDGISVRAAVAADYDRIAAVADEWWGRPILQVLPRLFLDHFHATSLIAEREADGGVPAPMRTAGKAARWLDRLPRRDGIHRDRASS